MKSLILMYVYYDDEGDIKAISPTPDISHKEHFSSATFPLSEVEMFLTGQRNPFDFTIKEVNRPGSKGFKIARKTFSVNLTRTLDNYLTRLEKSSDEIPTIRVVVSPTEKKISLKLDQLFKDLYKLGNDEEQDDVAAFINSGLSAIYITAKNNPYHHLHTVIFSPRALFDAGALYFEYDDTLDLSDVSAYTKRIVKSYGFSIRGK